MKRNPDLRLRKMGGYNVIVKVDEDTVDLTHVYTLNGTAARLWELCGDNDFTVSELALRICEEYDVDMDTAAADAERQLEEWKNAGLVL